MRGCRSRVRGCRLVGCRLVGCRRGNARPRLCRFDVFAPPSPRPSRRRRVRATGKGRRLANPRHPRHPHSTLSRIIPRGAVRNRRRRRRRRPRIAAATADTPPSPTSPRASAEDTRRRNPSPGPRVTREAATTTARIVSPRDTCRLITRGIARVDGSDPSRRTESQYFITASHLHSQRHGVQPREHLRSPVRERVELGSNPAIGTLSTEMNSDPRVLASGRR